MGDSWRTWSRPGDADPNDYTWGTDDTAPGCGYPEPHEHGFACEKTCPCRTEQHMWRNRKEASDGDA